jgi:hypothetical protein
MTTRLTPRAYVIALLVLAATVLFYWLARVYGPDLFPSQRTSSMSNSWISLPDPEAPRSSQWQQVGRASIYEVALDLRAEAQQMLESVPIREITEGQFLRYTGSAFKVIDQSKPYLVRGVRISGTRGMFEVYRRDKMLWVRYGCLTREPGDVMKHPLIIVLPTEPVVIYVDCSTAS